ncbi:MAG: hypothetical protein ACEQSK_16345 [Sphingomonadaceae bacterium]
MLRATFLLKNSTTSHFNPEAEQRLLSVPGVTDVLIGEASDTCDIIYDENQVSTMLLRDTLQAAGYDCELEHVLLNRTTCCGACS